MNQIEPDDIVAAAMRQTRKTKIQNKPYDKQKPITTLKENPQPITMPSKTRTQDIEMEIETEDINEELKSSNEKPSNNVENREDTEVLKEIDLSVIANPSINKTKRDSKEERKREMMTEKSKEKTTIKEVDFKLPSTQKEEEKGKGEEPNNKNDAKGSRINNKNEDRLSDKKEKHISLMKGNNGYDLATDLTSNTANITFAQLLDISPKLRAQLNKLLKLKETVLDKNVEEMVLSTVSKKDIATTKCKINGENGFAFLDTCASINIITSKFIGKLKNIKPFGYTTNNIIQVTSKTNISSELYHLTIEFKDFIIQDVFRVIDQDQDLFDILIGFRTLRDNNLFINPINNSLCKMRKDGTFITISELEIDRESEVEEEIESEDELHKNPDSMLFCFINQEPKELESSEVINYSKESKIKNTINKEKKTRIEQIIQNSIISVKDKFKELLDNNIEILAIKIEELGTTKLLPHRINLVESTIPIKQKAYRLSKVQANALKEELIKLLNNKLIEPSSSPWSSPVILVPKKNNKWRMCIDYRKLNNVTVKDAYSLPLIDDILFSIGRKVKVFSTIDLFSGFYQIPMYFEDIPKTSFTTMYGNYQFRVMPFGLCNAPGTFQREMNRIFFPLIGNCMFVYIDDLIIFSPTVEQHVEDLRKVFEIIKNNGLKINLDKCSFFKESVELLGHTVSVKGISPINKKIEIIREWLPPTNITQLQSFLGAVGYYRKFIHNFASIAKPLFKLLKKGVKFTWESAQQESFNELKRRLITAPILSMPDFNKQFIIRTDASKDGIGGVLIQKDDKNVEKPIHYMSRTLKPAEMNYGITDLEGAAAAYCVKKFKSYITGNQYETLLFTDHKPLISIFKSKETLNSRQSRWVIMFSMLKVNVIYEPGKRNVLADALSRLRTKSSEIIATYIEEINTGQNLLLKKFKEKFTKINKEEYFIDNGTFRKVIKDDNEKIRLILEAHMIGHEGIFKTYNRLKRDYYWNNMILDVKYLVNTCNHCQLFKPQTFNTNTENNPTKPGLPFTQVGLDIIGPLPQTKKGNQYIIVLVDYLTKWVEAEPTDKIESENVIGFLTRVFSRHGVPEVLVTDNGSQFKSDKTKAFLDLYGVFVHFVAVYHPESNGMVENRNKEIGKYLRILCNQNVTNWDVLLPSALWALRTCKSETTKFSSFELLYGRRDLQPFELTLNLDKREPCESFSEYLIRKFTKHYKWITEAINNISTANKIWEERRNQIKRMKANYNSGDLVLVRLINRRKLDPYFVGPLRIVKKEFNTVTLADPITGEIADRNVHLKNIVPYKLCEVETSGTKSN